MKKLDWIFDKEEFYNPLKIDDIINYNGTLIYYISEYDILRGKFMKITANLENRKISELKNYKNQLLFRINPYINLFIYESIWFVYNEKYIEIVNRNQ